MTELGPDSALSGARVIGSLAGSAISLVYMLPKGRREAAGRFLTGVACGLIFGDPTGLWLARKLDLLTSLAPEDIVLAGATAASLLAWWSLGLLVRLLDRYGARPRG